MAPRPGRIAEEVRITAPAERGEEFRTSPEYAAQCRTVSHALSSAMGGAHE
jgi:NitT/TauT family transport system ATP-binding protein